ncbi:MAG: ATP-dependent Clp protease ATP-binding subunit ClpX [Bacteroidota bacterium]|nr:ATP-dependent Clp protease ATP-binding subunit ClpX [Bacteroidota bacterium]
MADKCSFCDAPRNQVNILIKGKDGFICDYCASEANKIAQTETGRKFSEQNLTRVPKPKEISKFLDKYIIGQNQAKKVIAVAVYNHYKRLKNNLAKSEVEIDKSNILLVGNTGTGKTLIAQTIAKMLNVPFCIADATVLTEAGYVGEDVETVLTRLLEAADYNEKEAENGIVYIDELDKITRKSDNASITRDVSGEGVQQALLKLLEGHIINVPPKGGRKHPEQSFVKINTQNILFICGGAFNGLDKIINRRINTQNIGFKSVNSKDDKITNPLKYTTPHDLRKFGLIPELIGRLPIISYLDSLDKQALIKILTQPKNAITKQYAKMLDIEGVKFKINKNAIEYIAEKSIELETGARGLRSLFEHIMIDAMYELPTANDVTEYTVTLKDVKQKLGELKIGQSKVA